MLLRKSLSGICGASFFVVIRRDYINEEQKTIDVGVVRIGDLDGCAQVAWSTYEPWPFGGAEYTQLF